jgi:hypothetical protein
MRCGARSDAHARRRNFGRAGMSTTRRSPRCPSLSAARPIFIHCAPAGQLRAWLRHVHIVACGAAGAAARCGAARGRRRLCGVVVWPCRWIKNTPIAALPEWLGSFSNLVNLCVRWRCAVGRGAGSWVRAEAGGLEYSQRDGRAGERGGTRVLTADRAEAGGSGQNAAGCVWGARSDACERRHGGACSEIVNTPIAALPESFGSLSNLVTLCARRHCVRGCGTRASVRHGTGRDAEWHGIGWAYMTPRSVCT